MTDDRQTELTNRLLGRLYDLNGLPDLDWERSRYCFNWLAMALLRDMNVDRNYLRLLNGLAGLLGDGFLNELNLRADHAFLVETLKEIGEAFLDPSDEWCLGGDLRAKVEGWYIGRTPDDLDVLMISAYPDYGHFASHEAAARFVAERAASGCAVARKALRVIDLNNGPILRSRSADAPGDAGLNA